MALSVGTASTPTLNQNYTVTNPTYSVAAPTAQPSLSVTTGSGYGGLFNTGSPQVAGKTATPTISYNSTSGSGGSAGTTSGAYGGYSSAAAQQAARAGSQADIATYTDNIAALNNLLSQADIDRSQGIKGINDSFDTSNARLADQQQGTMNNYQNQQDNTTRGYQTNLNTINNQARSGYQALQSLLGGSGSAGEILAPLAVANQAGGQTNTARDTYAQNLQSLATARTDAQKQYKNSQDDLLGQKNDKLQSLIHSIDAQKANYLSQIGQQQNLLNIAKGGSYATPTAQNVAIAQLQAEENGLYDQYKAPAFTPQNVNVQAPNLNPYVAQAAQIGGGSNQQATVTDPSIALQALLRQQDNNYNPYGA